jgi:hypothetical protein
MSFHGGLLGVLVAVLWWSRKRACTSSTPWISSRRWCRWAWASAARQLHRRRVVGQVHRCRLGRDLPACALSDIPAEAAMEQLMTTAQIQRSSPPGCSTLRAPSVAAV